MIMFVSMIEEVWMVLSMAFVRRFARGFVCVCFCRGDDGKGVGELLGGRAAVGCNEGRDEGRDEGEIGVWVGV